MLLAVTNDLMTAAPIEHAGRQLGLPLRTASLAQCRELQQGSSVQLVLLDLNAVDQVAEAVTTLRTVLHKDVPIVAFGPHVHAEKLQAARQAGCTQVLTRGQFHGRANEIIAAALANEP